MDRITEKKGPASQPVASSKVTELQYDIAVGRRCAKCKQKTERCKCGTAA